MNLIFLLGMGLAEAAERRFALVIGNNRGDVSEEPLRFAEQDARRFAGVLRELGGVAPEELIQLNGVREEQIRGVLQRLAERIRALPAEDEVLLIVYYSGHADASSLHLSGSRLPLAELRRLVEAVPADARLMILDACRTGELTRRKGASPVAPFQIQVDDALRTDGLAIITSAAAGEDAQESDRLQGGVFTHHFVAGLMGAADSSADGRVTLTEAYRYSYSRTLVATSTAPTLQHPSFAFDLRGQADLVLTRLSSSTAIGWLRLQQPGDYIVFEARDRSLVADLQVDRGALLALPEGRYALRWRSPSHLKEASLVVQAGQTVELRPEQLQSVPYAQSTRRGGQDEDRLALGIFALGGLGSSGLSKLPPLPALGLGARVETDQLSLLASLGAGRLEVENEDLALQHGQLSGEIAAMHLFDLGPFSLGPGLGLGGDVAVQRFTTEGEAPDNSAGLARLGPRMQLDWAPGARFSLGAQAALDIGLLPGEDGVHSAVIPHGALHVTWWAF